jgi:hypothetical protein
MAVGNRHVTDVGGHDADFRQLGGQGARPAPMGGTRVARPQPVRHRGNRVGHARVPQQPPLGMADQVAVVHEVHRLAEVDARRPAGDVAGHALAAVEDVQALDSGMRFATSLRRRHAPLEHKQREREGAAEEESHPTRGHGLPPASPSRAASVQLMDAGATACRPTVRRCFRPVHGTAVMVENGPQLPSGRHRSGGEGIGAWGKFPCDVTPARLATGSPCARAAQAFHRTPSHKPAAGDACPTASSAVRPAACHGR